MVNPLHININDICLQKYIFSKKKKNQDRWQWFVILQTSIMSGLIEVSWILISASVSNLTQYVILVEVYEDYLASQIYIS